MFSLQFSFPFSKIEINICICSLSDARLNYNFSVTNISISSATICWPSPIGINWFFNIGFYLTCNRKYGDGRQKWANFEVPLSKKMFKNFNWNANKINLIFQISKRKKRQRNRDSKIAIWLSKFTRSLKQFRDIFNWIKLKHNVAITNLFSCLNSFMFKFVWVFLFLHCAGKKFCHFVEYLNCSPHLNKIIAFFR